MKRLALILALAVAVCLASCTDCDNNVTCSDTDSELYGTTEFVTLSDTETKAESFDKESDLERDTLDT